MLVGAIVWCRWALVCARSLTSAGESALCVVFVVSKSRRVVPQLADGPFFVEDSTPPSLCHLHVFSFHTMSLDAPKVREKANDTVVDVIRPALRVGAVCGKSHASLSLLSLMRERHKCPSLAEAKEKNKAVRHPFATLGCSITRRAHF